MVMHFISTSDLMGPDWRFLEPLSTDPAITWSTHSGLPRTPLERRIRRPALARYRAAFEAAREARNAPGPFSCPICRWWRQPQISRAARSVRRCRKLPLRSTLPICLLGFITRGRGASCFFKWTAQFCLLLSIPVLVMC